MTASAVQAVTASTGTVTLNAASYSAVVLTLTGSGVTVALSGGASGTDASVVLYVTQSGGPYTLTWPAVTWAGGPAPALGSGTSIFTFASPDAGGTWYGAEVTGAPNLPLSTSNGGTGLAAGGPPGTFLAATGLTSAGTWTGLLPPGTVQTSNFTATPGKLNEADATSGNITATLPAGGFSGQLAAVKMINTASGHTTTIQPTAPDILGRTTGWTSGSYPTASTPYAMSGQGQLLTYNPPGAAWSAGFTASSANITITTGTAPYAVGQLVFFAATTMPAGLVAGTPYYVTAVTGPVSGVCTIQVSATSTGSGIAPATAGSTVLIASCGGWTTVADDLPLPQLDLRYAAAGSVSGFTNPMTTAGDLLFEDATPAPARLPAGGDGQILGLTGGLPAWRTPNSWQSTLIAPAAATAETYPRYLATTTVGSLTSGTLYLTLIGLPAGFTVNSIAFYLGGAAKAGGTHGWYCILDAGRVLRGVSADQTDTATTWGTPNTAQSLALATPYVTTSPGAYYLGVMIAAATMPSFCCTAALPAAVQAAPAPGGASTAGLTTPGTAGSTSYAAVTSSGKPFYATVS